jgi:hypothetical protein
MNKALSLNLQKEILESSDFISHKTKALVLNISLFETKDSFLK